MSASIPCALYMPRLIILTPFHVVGSVMGGERMAFVSIRIEIRTLYHCGS
jgi:hypothetical protein